MSYKAAIFDLDGTLLNTISDIATCVNEFLSQNDLPTHNDEAYYIFVGDGLEHLIERALPQDSKNDFLINEGVKYFEKRYKEKWNDKTQPYKGVLDILADLEKDNVSLSILSNKPHNFTLEMVSHFFNNTNFDKVYGARKEIPLKPDPESLLNLISEINLKPEEVIYVGDSDIDIITAKNAKVFSVGVAWGFRGEQELLDAGADRIIYDVEELKTFF